MCGTPTGRCVRARVGARGRTSTSFRKPEQLNEPELQLHRRVDRRQIAALAGLAPYNVDSGQHQGKRRIRGGRAPIRRVLYMACWSVIRTQADFKTRYRLLRQRGKCAKVAVTACMRVLLTRLNAMVRDRAGWKAARG